MKKKIIDIQEKYMTLQSGLAQKSRLNDIIFIAVFLTFIIAFSAAIFIMPDKTFSEQENRYLQEFPKIQSDFNGNVFERIAAGKFLDRLANGKFTTEIADYLSDQFPLRDVFVGMKAVSEIAILKSENNNIIAGSDGYIIKREDYPDTGNLSSNISALESFAGDMEDLSVPVTFAVAGRSIDVLWSKFPLLFPLESSERIISELNQLTEEIGYVDLFTPMREKIAGGETLYYKTDHHWTTEGAYAAYTLLAEQMDFEAFPKEYFTIETVTDSFYGTTWSSAGMKWIKPDSIQYFRFPDEENYTTEIPAAGRQFNSFYDLSYLEKKDKYSSFLSGNNALVTVKKDGEEREKLLVVKDSYAHSLSPFLALHYDLYLLDLRYYNGSVSTLIADEGIDAVLILYNIANLCDDTSLATIVS